MVSDVSSTRALRWMVVSGRWRDTHQLFLLGLQSTLSLELEQLRKRIEQRLDIRHLLSLRLHRHRDILRWCRDRILSTRTR